MDHKKEERFNKLSNAPTYLYSSDKDIVSWGSAHTFSLDNLVIFMGGVKFILDFINDGEKQRIESAATSEKELKIKLFNFNNSLGAGTTKPVKVGNFRNRELYFAFTVYALNKTSIKLLHYTFFLGRPINV